MKFSMKLLYFNVAALALMHLATPSMAMEAEEKQKNPQVKQKSSSAVQQQSKSTAPDFDEMTRRLEVLGRKPNPSPAKAEKKVNFSEGPSSASSKEEDPRQGHQQSTRPVKPSEKKRLDPPAELSHDELATILQAPYKMAYPLLPETKRDRFRGKTSTEVEQLLGSLAYSMISEGASSNASRVELKNHSLFASLKETDLGQKRITHSIPKNGRVVAVLDDVETRSLSTMGQEYDSVFGVYQLYDVATEAEITYLHEVSKQQRPVKFRVAFSKHKE